MENWITSKENSSLVLSSRIRLARNLKDIPFPHKLDINRGRDIVEKIENGFYTTPAMKQDYKSFRLWEKDSITNRAYLEKHVISKKLLGNNEKAGLIINKDETASIMINEEDHIRLQCITNGLNLYEVYKEADKLDNLIEENVEIAFDDKLGYLTACPTNLGTGLRASVMVHLPALSMNNEITTVLNAVSQFGMTIRGLYGEGSSAEGNIYQISNQITLGLTEEEIINNLTAVVNQIIDQENMTREKLIKKYKYELEDKINRSLGILKSAVILNLNEYLELISNVKMGIEMKIVDDLSYSINSLIIDMQPALMQLNSNGNLSEKEINIKRARLVREMLN